MSVKIKFLVLFFCTNGLLYSQKNKTQLLLQKKGVNVEIIELNISTGPLYIKDPKTFITGIRFVRREEDSLTVFYKYDFENDYINTKAVNKISNSILDSFVKEINKLDFEKINNSNDYNIYDGRTYELNIIGEGYTASLWSHAPDSGTKERGLEDFYNLCTKIWSYTKNEN